MSTEKTTIAQLWEEYTVGLNGGPSIKELNERHGTRWRQYQGGRQVYHNHSLVYEEIERRIKKGSNKADAVAAVQVMMDDHTVHPESRKRGRQHSQFPLHKLAVALQKLHRRRRTHDSSTPVRNVCATWCVSASVRACVRACVRASERARRVRCQECMSRAGAGAGSTTSRGTSATSAAADASRAWECNAGGAGARVGRDQAPAPQEEGRAQGEPWLDPIGSMCVCACVRP